MRLQYTDRFQRAYNSLDDAAAARVDRALQLLAADLHHSGLRVKKIKGTKGIWEARAGLNIRLTFEMQSDLIILRNVGPHDKTLGRP
ncbi:MAG: hypothetical protein M1358_17510 [Chloroflexi bacterium]|nr:hypothetical protein [Chloroflexota bacterium]